MASFEAEAFPAASMTDCPRCGHLCLGASILPCGHLACKRCLHALLDEDEGKGFACPTCSSQVDTEARGPRSQRLGSFPEDAVMQCLVHDKLTAQSPQPCSVPHKKQVDDATHVCWDCGEMYCQSCTYVHQNMNSTKRHVLKSLKPSCESGIKSHTPSPPRESHDAVGLDNKKNMQQDALQEEIQLIEETLAKTDSITKLAKTLQKDQENRQKMLAAYKDYVLSADISSTSGVKDIVQRLRAVRNSLQTVAQAEMQNIKQVVSSIGLEQKQDSMHTSLAHDKDFWSWSSGWWRHQLPWPLFHVLLMCILSVPVLVLATLIINPGQPTPVTPYDLDNVTVKPLGVLSRSLTGQRWCGSDYCSSKYDGWISQLIMTRDNQLVIAMEDSLVIESSLGTDTINLNCRPNHHGLAQLRNGLLVVCCQTVRLVNISDHRISELKIGCGSVAVDSQYSNTVVTLTKKQHHYQKMSIDTLMLFGETVVGRPLVLVYLEVGSDAPLVINNGEVLIGKPGSNVLYRVPISTITVEQNTETVLHQGLSDMHALAIDDRGGIFVATGEGIELLVGTENSFTDRTLLTWDERGYSHVTVAVHNSRLLVARVKKEHGQFKSLVTEYALV